MTGKKPKGPTIRSARLSSVSGRLRVERHPDIQNIPIRTEEGQAIREALVAHRDRNRGPIQCRRCGKTVEPGAGYVSGKDAAGKWDGIHHDCIPVHKCSHVYPRADDPPYTCLKCGEPQPGKPQMGWDLPEFEDRGPIDPTRYRKD
jgi:hypothetical protein